MLDKLGIADSHIVANDVVSISPLGNWHAHTISVSRHHGFIFINDATLFSFVIFNVPLKTITNKFSEAFMYSFQGILSAEGFPEGWIEKVGHLSDTFMVGKTRSKQVLGTINELIKHYQYAMLGRGGAKQCNYGELICEMNRIPHKNINYNYAIEEMNSCFNALMQRHFD